MGFKAPLSSTLNILVTFSYLHTASCEYVGLISKDLVHQDSIKSIKITQEHNKKHVYSNP